MIFGSDVLNIPPDAGVEVLLKENFRATAYTNWDGVIKRKAPFEVLTPFSDLEQGAAILAHDTIQDISIFALNVPRGVLAGERAVVTHPKHYLITDTDHYNHSFRIFETEERRRFESVHLVPEEGGYLYDETAHPHVEISGEAVALTAMEQDNYGAFLLRVVPKIIAIKQLGFSDKKIIASLNSWQSNILRNFGINVDEIIPYDNRRTYIADNLIVSSMRTSEFFIDDSSRIFFNEAASRISKSNENQKYEKIYISRITQGKKRPDYRFFMNEVEFADKLKSKGFFIFEPEAHSFEDQVSIFNAAKVVIGPGGAGMFNTVFCKPGTTVISLEPMTNWLILHANVFSSMGHNYGLILGGADRTDTGTQKRWSTDIDAVTRFLDRSI